MDTKTAERAEKLIDRAEAMTLLSTKAMSYWSMIKFVFQIPLILTSSTMCILNSFDDGKGNMRVPNVVVNGTSVLLISMQQQMKVSEKYELFKKLSGEYLAIAHTLEGPYRSSSGDYYRAYENYLKFFGAYYSKRASPVSFQEWLKSQIFCIDLVNIDSEQIFANSGNALIIEIEYSYNAGSVSAGKTFKFICNLLYDKMLSIQHSENKAILNLT